MPTSTAELWGEISAAAAGESALWAEALLVEPQRDAVFSALTNERYALGVETIYEGYLVHYGHPRLFGPADADTALLLGDYLYAHGLVRIAELGNVDAVGDLAELISLCAHLRGDGREGDGAAWAATAAGLGRGELADARAALRDDADPEPLGRLARELRGDEAVGLALELHARRFA